MKQKGWRKITVEEFIKSASKIHDFKYDYTYSEFATHESGNIKLMSKIDIKCINHENIFPQKLNEHLNGISGCKDCKAEKRKKTMVKRHGVEHALQSNKIKKQFTATMQERYGCEYAMQSDELSERYRKSLQSNYGVDHPSQSRECYANRNKVMVELYGVEYAMQSDELSDRYRKSLQSNYGVDVPLKSKIIHDRFKTTMNERYGHEYTAEIDWLFKQMKQTNLEKYGVEYPLQNKEIQEKQKQTNLEKYGYEYPLQSKEIRNNIRIKMEKEGRWIPKDLLSEAQLYYKQVIKITNKQSVNSLENYNLRGLAGIEGAYHIDHKVSIKYGFENSIPPYIIGNINNLEMLPWFDNIYKSSNCSIDIGGLFTLMML